MDSGDTPPKTNMTNGKKACLILIILIGDTSSDWCFFFNRHVRFRGCTLEVFHLGSGILT